MVLYKAPNSDNYLSKDSHVVGTTAVRLLGANKDRAGYRVHSSKSNIDLVWHGQDNEVSSSSLDQISPGGVLKDEGEWYTIYRGEVWAIAGSANQIVYTEEIVRG